MSLLRWIILTATCVAALAIEGELLEPRAAKCQQVLSSISQSSCQSSATAYCSSYLHINAATTTSTTTVTVAGPTSTTSIATSTQTVTSITGITSTSTTSVFSIPSQCYYFSSFAKRAKPTSVRPSCLGDQPASSVASSQCSCLSIPTPTSTLTSTATSTSTSIQTIGYITTITVTSTQTSVLTSTTTYSQFRLQASYAANAGSAGSVEGLYAALIAQKPTNAQFVATNEASGDLFQFDEDCLLQSRNPSYSGYLGWAANNLAIIFKLRQPGASYSIMQCAVYPSSNGEMDCQGTLTDFHDFACTANHVWYLGNPGGCEGFITFIVPPYGLPQA